MSDAPQTRIAYECFRIVSGGRYQNRDVTAVFWSEGDATLHVGTDKTLKVGKLHLVNINGQWHRYYIRPYSPKGRYDNTVKEADK